MADTATIGIHVFAFGIYVSKINFEMGNRMPQRSRRKLNFDVYPAMTLDKFLELMSASYLRRRSDEMAEPLALRVNGYATYLGYGEVTLGGIANDHKTENNTVNIDVNFWSTLTGVGWDAGAFNSAVANSEGVGAIEQAATYIDPALEWGCGQAPSEYYPDWELSPDA